MKKFPKEFEEQTVTISRKEFGMILADEIMSITEDVEDKDMFVAFLLRDLLTDFGARIMGEMFNSESKEDLEL